jgi:uncharacterized protein YwqG
MTSDRYDALMARREALLDAASARVQAMRDEFFRTAPLASRSWGSTAPTLGSNGRLSVTVHEEDEYHRRVEAFTLVCEVDGTIRQVPDAAVATDPGPDPRVRDGAAEPTYDELAALARQHLGPTVAQAWLKHLAPAVRLAHAQPGDLVVAQLGGPPILAINSWPVWSGHGPLSHIMSIDCAKLSPMLPDLGLPRSGRLAFFYFDGQFDGFIATVGSWDPETQAGARTLWFDPEAEVPPELAPVVTQAPAGLKPFPTIALTAIPTLTWPTWDQVELRRLWTAHGLEQPRPGVPAEPVAALYGALHRRGYKVPNHQLGGHAFPEQCAVEMDIAELALRRSGATGIDRSSPAFEEHERGWQLLLQIDTDDDANMMWGDVGKLYFLARAGEPGAGKHNEVAFTWQCG